MKTLLALALAISLLFTGSLNAQPAKDALKALKKIDATVSMGVNFSDYARLMAESNYTMQEYLNKPIKNKPLDKAIKDAWDLYVLAKRTWTNSNGQPDRYISREAIPTIWHYASKKVKLASQLDEISK